jgi:hypothetical protein
MFRVGIHVSWTHGSRIGKNCQWKKFLVAQTSVGSCEKINNLIRRLTDQGAKTRREQLLCFLRAFYDFVRQPTDEMLLLIQGLFHSFLVMSAPC